MLNKAFNEGDELFIYLNPVDILRIEPVLEEFNGESLVVTKIVTRQGSFHYVEDRPEIAANIWGETLRMQSEAAAGK